MLTKFTGTLVAAAIALTTFGTAPARADNEDAARALAALAGIAILAKILSDRKDDDRVVTRQHTTQQPREYRPRAHRPRAHRPRAHQPNYQPIKPRHARPAEIKPKRLPPRLRNGHRAKLLPKNCFRSYRTRDGKAHVFNRRCLKRNYRHVESLPRGCFVKFRSRGDTIRGYDARCLRNRGYALARG